MVTFHTSLVWRNRGTLDAHVVLLDGFSCVNRHLIVRLYKGYITSPFFSL